MKYKKCIKINTFSSSNGEKEMRFEEGDDEDAGENDEDNDDEEGELESEGEANDDDDEEEPGLVESSSDEEQVIGDSEIENLSDGESSCPSSEDGE